MPIDERNISLPEQWAKEAQTVIPAPPVPGIAYRNTAITPEQWAHGQDYSRVADSAQWNQMFWTMSGLLKHAEQYGVMPYSPFTDYPELGICMGADGQLYQALQPSGPNSGGAKPTTDTLYWQVAVGTGIGPDNTVWTSFGGSSFWAHLGISGRMVFTSASGAWVVPENVRKIIYIITGGGGSGAWSQTTPTEASGGGAGGTAIGVENVIPGNSYNYIIGAGGIAPTRAGESNDGGNSSFMGATANGGKGGYTSSSIYVCGPVPGGIATGGLINLKGNPSEPTNNYLASDFASGNGGASIWGGAGMGVSNHRASYITQSDVDASNYGSGGGSFSQNIDEVTLTAGKGSDGCLLIIY